MRLTLKLKPDRLRSIWARVPPRASTVSSAHSHAPAGDDDGDDDEKADEKDDEATMASDTPQSQSQSQSQQKRRRLRKAGGSPSPSLSRPAAARVGTRPPTTVTRAPPAAQQPPPDDGDPFTGSGEFLSLWTLLQRIAAFVQHRHRHHVLHSESTAKGGTWPHAASTTAADSSSALGVALDEANHPAFLHVVATESETAAVPLVAPYARGLLVSGRGRGHGRGAKGGKARGGTRRRTLRSRNAYIDRELQAMGGADSFADLDDFVVPD